MPSLLSHVWWPPGGGLVGPSLQCYFFARSCLPPAILACFPIAVLGSLARLPGRPPYMQRLCTLFLPLLLCLCQLISHSPLRTFFFFRILRSTSSPILPAKLRSFMLIPHPWSISPSFYLFSPSSSYRQHGAGSNELFLSPLGFLDQPLQLMPLFSLPWHSASPCSRLSSLSPARFTLLSRLAIP